MPFAERIKPLWDRSELTLAELAERCSISESSASRYMNGKISPPADVAERILEVLGGDQPQEEEPEGSAQMQNQFMLQIQQLHETYKSQIAHLQENFKSHLATMQAHYDRQIADLRRDKLVLFITVLILIGLLVYFILDGLHGNWGIIRYAMAEGGPT